MTKRFSQTLLAAGAALALVTGLSGAASAAGIGSNFTIDETCGGSGLCAEAMFAGIIPNIDRVSFSYQAIIDQSNDGSGLGGILDGDAFAENGFLQFGSYLNDAGGVIPSLLNTPGGYGVYATFEATGTAVVTPLGQIDVTFDAFTMEFFIDDDLDTILTNSDDGIVGNAIVNPVSVSNNADDNLIATATVLGANDTLLQNSLNDGSFEIQLTDFGRNLFGESFLTSPEPFYTLMSFTGVTTELDPDGSATDPFVTTATGSGDLFFVPEPGTMTLFGVGLLGLGMSMRRRYKKAAAA